MKERGDKQLSDRLWALLGDRDMTPAELDRRCGFSVGMVSGWLNRTRGITLRNLRKLKQALMCTWEQLLGP